MLEQNSEQNAYRGFATPSAPEISRSPTHDPQEGARLIRAFLRITDPALRSVIVQMVEKIGSAPAGC